MDIKIIETGNGGDLQKQGNDLAWVQGWENMVYLGMFGGNPEQSTPLTRDPVQQAQDYWANSLLYPDDTSIQFNSETERTLYEVPLTPNGRLKIEGAIKRDLDFMRSFAIVTVATRIIATDQLEIDILVARPDNLEQRQFIYIWDATLRELTSSDVYTPNPISFTAEALQYEMGWPL